MALIEFRLDTAGIAEVLKSGPFRDLMNAKAIEVAANVRSQLPENAPVEFRPYTTDRQAAAVVVRHPRAAQWQDQDHILSRAARAAGLEVTERTTGRQ